MAVSYSSPPFSAVAAVSACAGAGGGQRLVGAEVLCWVKEGRGHAQREVHQLQAPGCLVVCSHSDPKQTRSRFADLRQ